MLADKKIRDLGYPTVGRLFNQAHRSRVHPSLSAAFHNIGFRINKFLNVEGHIDLPINVVSWLL